MKKQLSFLIFFLLISTSRIHAQVNPNEIVAANMILTADIDGDGTISKLEASDDVLKDFELIDTNKDKFIDQAELVYYLSNRENK